MSFFKTLLNNKLMIVGIIIVVVILGMYYFCGGGLKFLEGFENSASSSSSSGPKNAIFYLFFSNKCPYCTKIAGIYSNFKLKYEGKTINGYNILFKDIDCTKPTAETEELQNKFNVEGVPTLKLLINGNIVSFEANITADGLEKFVADEIH